MEQLQKYEMKSEPVSEEKVEFVKSLVKGLMRPFTLNELVPQIKDVSKKEFAAIFTSLVEKNEVLVKIAGKMKIFYFNYKMDALKESEDLDMRINKYLSKTEDKRMEVEKLEELKRGIVDLPVEELEKEANALKKRLDILLKEIEEQKQKMAIQVLPKQSLKRKHDNSLDEYQKRKRMCNRVVDVMSEKSVKPRKDLLNDMQIVTDDTSNFNINTHKL